MTPDPKPLSFLTSNETLAWPSLAIFLSDDKSSRGPTENYPPEVKRRAEKKSNNDYFPPLKAQQRTKVQTLNGLVLF